MKVNRIVVTSAVLAALSAPLLASGQDGPAPMPKFDHEKCYGITKAGKNDCQTANSACAGTSKRDKQADAWVFVPKGTCEKLVDGSLKPKRT